MCVVSRDDSTHQSHTTAFRRGCYRSIKLIGHHRIHVTCRIVSCEEMMTAVSATDGCEVVMGVVADLDIHVVAVDAVRNTVMIALCCDLR